MVFVASTIFIGADSFEGWGAPWGRLGEGWTMNIKVDRGQISELRKVNGLCPLNYSWAIRMFCSIHKLPPLPHRRTYLKACLAPPVMQSLFLSLSLYICLSLFCDALCTLWIGPVIFMFFPDLKSIPACNAIRVRALHFRVIQLIFYTFNYFWKLFIETQKFKSVL